MKGEKIWYFGKLLSIDLQTVWQAEIKAHKVSSLGVLRGCRRNCLDNLKLFQLETYVINSPKIVQTQFVIIHCNYIHASLLHCAHLFQRNLICLSLFWSSGDSLFQLAQVFRESWQQVILRYPGNCDISHPKNQDEWFKIPAHLR